MRAPLSARLVLCVAALLALVNAGCETEIIIEVVADARDTKLSIDLKKPDVADPGPVDDADEPDGDEDIDPDGNGPGPDDAEDGQSPSGDVPEQDGTLLDGAALDAAETAPCTPSCVGKSCGSDGCGGECGVCFAGAACNASFQCAQTGAGCFGAIPVAASGFDGTASVKGHPDVLSCDGPSGPVGLGTGDVTFRLDSPDTARYRVTLNGSAGLLLYARETCSGKGACLATATPGQSLDLDLLAGQSVYFVVDGTAAQPEFQLKVTSCQDPCAGNVCGTGKCGLPCTCASSLVCVESKCIPPAAGDSCEQPPKEVSALPYSDKDNLALHTDATVCTGAPGNGKDVVYRINPANPMRARVELIAGFDGFVRAGPDCTAGSCGTIIPAGVVAGLDVPGNKVTHLVVEGASAAASGAYVLTIVDCASVPCDGTICTCALGKTCQQGQCVASAGGGSCGEPLKLTPGASGQTLDAFGNSQSCKSVPGGRDAVLTFQAPSTATWYFGVTATFAARIFRLGTCGDAASCSGMAEGPAALELSLTAGELVTLVVEATDPAASGGFTIAVEDCQAACAGKPCDAVGCGKLCGCPDTMTCVLGACQESGTLDSCETAGLITTVPFSAKGTLATAGDLLGCGPGAGQGTADDTYRFVAPSTGVYVASVDGDGPLVVLRPKACASGSQQCVGPVAAAAVFLAHQGETVWLTVDSLDGKAGAYDLSIARVVGYPGGLGAACATVANCPLADACVAGICTVTCDPLNPQGCDGASSGPRGSAFGCPADVVVPTTSTVGPSRVCLPGVGTGEAVLCDAESDCSATSRTCAGHVRAAAAPSAPIFGGACIATGTLGKVGTACASDQGCASHLCRTGKCRSLCLESTGCGAGVCALDVLVSGASGTCLATGSACASDAGCGADSYCGLVPAPVVDNGAVCLPKLGGTATGAPCTVDDACMGGVCLFTEVSTLKPSYCSRACVATSDCPAGYSCRPYPVWDHGTPSDPKDDATLNLCVDGTPSSTCLLAPWDTCNEPFVCQDTLAAAPYGLCF